MVQSAYWFNFGQYDVEPLSEFDYSYLQYVTNSPNSNNHANFHCPCRGRSIGRLCPGPYLPIRGKPVLFFPARNDPLSYVLDVILR